VDRISPEAPVPVVELQQKEDLLGGAANVALNLKSLGAKPTLCSVVGDDQQGRAFLELLGIENIDKSGMITIPGRVSTTKYRIIGNKMQMLRVDHETDKDIEPEYEKQLLDRVEIIIQEKKPEVIILQDYNKGVLTSVVIKGITNLARIAGIPVVVDPKKKNFGTYKGIKLFKPNLKEIREGLNTEIDPSGTEGLKVACETIRKDNGHEMIMITLSEAGVFIHSAETTGIIKGHVRSVADVSGAGDTVISVAALCIAAGTSPEKMAALANLAGGQVCEEVGVVPVNKAKLLQEALELLVDQKQK
jgi:D-glycero-beta-D-manno-heptose-7-phosphate kinase